MEFTDKQLLHDEPFFKIELSASTSILFLTYSGEFDFDRYKESCMMVIDFMANGKCRYLISDHRFIDVLPREAQKWFTGEMTQIIKTKLGKDLDKLVFVAITSKKDPVRNVVAGFLAYMVNLFIGARFHYANTLEEALAYCDIKLEKRSLE